MFGGFEVMSGVGFGKSKDPRFEIKDTRLGVTDEENKRFPTNQLLTHHHDGQVSLSS